MPDFSRSRQPPNFVDDVMRGPVAWFVDDEYAVHFNNVNADRDLDVSRANLKD